jgi:hypothetical protein
MKPEARTANSNDGVMENLQAPEYVAASLSQRITPDHCAS